MKNHFGYIKITLPACFLAAHERRYHYLTRLGAIPGFSGAGSCGNGGGETDELWYPHRYDTVSTEFYRPDGLKLNIYQRDLPNFDVCRVSVLSRPSSDYSVAVRLLYFREY